VPKDAFSDSGKTDICKALVGNLFADADALNDALDEAVSDYNEADKKSDKGSSGSGGRDSGSSDVSMQVVKDTEKEDIKEPETNEPFGDLENHSWAKDSIYELYNNGIVNGKAEGIFAPNDSITRAEAVKMIILALSEVNSEAECSFSNVNVGSWMYPFVATAATKGIVNGYSNEYFGADDAVTREDFAVIIVRAAEAIGSEFDAEGVTFADSEEIADYALEAVYKLKRAGIINGAGENQFMPKAFATRAEAAKIIAALVD